MILMGCVMMLLFVPPAYALAAPQSTPGLIEPPQPQLAEPTFSSDLDITTGLSRAGLNQIEVWQRAQADKLGPPTPYLWLTWKLQRAQPSATAGGTKQLGCEQFPLQPPRNVQINMTHVTAGLWQFVATLNDRESASAHCLLVGQLLVEIEDGVPMTIATVALQPPVSLKLTVNMDDASPDNPTLLGIGIIGPLGLIELRLVEATTKTTTLQFATLPAGPATVVVVALSDKPPSRAGIGRGVITGTSTLVIPLTRSGTTDEQPTALLLAGRSVVFFWYN